MKISFSTLGCPSWTWNEITSVAKDFGYEGIEIRGIENELYVPSAKPFKKESIQKTMANLKSLGLSICCITSGCLLHKDDKDYVFEGKEYIDLASKLNVPYVRVLVDSEPQPSSEVDINRATKNLSILSDYAKTKSVMPLVETNGIFANSDTLNKLLEGLDSDNVGVVWDIHHPYRFFNEPPSYTYNNLKNYIKHIHIKDSKIVDGKIKYVLTGEGDLPVKECMDLLKKDNFDGFLSIEWVKRWLKDLTEPGIVFMQYIEYIKSLLK